MKTNATKSEETRISRLQIVRDGRAETATPSIPRRGRAMVDIDSVIADPKNERKTFRGIEEFAETIKRIGIVEPPTAVPLQDGRYMLTTGERRWRAAKVAGEKRIAIIIGDPEDERTRRMKSLISNVQREDLGPVELANGLQEMKDDNPDIKTNRDLAAVIGKSEQWVGGMLKILDLPEDVREKIRTADRVVPYDAVIQVARLSDKKVQHEVLQNILSGFPPA